MIDDEAKWFIDHRCAVAHRDGRSVLYPIQEVGEGALVEVEAGAAFSALQFLGDDRRITVRHTGLHRLLNGEVVSVRLSWPQMQAEIAPLIRRGKWGGVLLHREHYPRPRPLSKKDAKMINFARAYGANLNMDNYGNVLVGVDLAAPVAAPVLEHGWAGWTAAMGVPREMLEPPGRSVCRMQLSAWMNRTR